MEADLRCRPLTRRFLLASLNASLWTSLAVVALGLTAHAADETTGDVHAACPADQIWKIDARCAPVCGDLLQGTQRLRFFRRVGCRWQASSLEEFLASGGAAYSTCIAVHGNRTDNELADEYGLSSYHRLRQSGRCCGPLRLVLWSWPSERTHVVNRADVLEKGMRSDSQGYYLAWLIQQMDPTEPICLLGYSHGCRASAGALHLLAGGSVARRTLPGTPVERLPLRAILMAGAVDNDTFLPGRTHGQALSQVDRILVMYNPRDSILRLYPRLERSLLPDALGYSGISNIHRLGAERNKVQQLNVSRWVSEHDFREYLASCAVGSYMVPYVFRPPVELPVDTSPLEISPAETDAAPLLISP